MLSLLIINRKQINYQIRGFLLYEYRVSKIRSRLVNRRYISKPVVLFTHDFNANAEFGETDARKLDRIKAATAEENTRYTNKTDMPRRKFGDPRNETLGNHLWHGISKRVLILPTMGRPKRVIEFPASLADRIKIETEITFRAEPFYVDGLITWLRHDKLVYRYFVYLERDHLKNLPLDVE